MARLLRGYGVSHLGKPQVVNPPVVFDPVKRYLTYSSKLARVSHSRRITPAVVGAPIVFAPIKRYWIPSPKQGRAAHSRLYPPAVVNTPTVFGAVKIDLAPGHRPRPPHSVLQPPAVVAPFVVAFTPNPVFVWRAAARKPRLTHSVLQPPTIVGPVVVVGFLPTPVFIWRTVSHRPAATHSKLQGPTTLNPPVVFGALQIVRVPSPKQSRVTHTRLATGPFFPSFTPSPIFRSLAPRPSHRTRLTRGVLGKPQAVSGAVTFGPITTSFRVAVGRAAVKHPASYKINLPTVVSIPSGSNPSGGVFDPNYFLIIHS